MKIRDIKEKVPITDFLYRLGYSPVRKSRKENLYVSPIRDSDMNASFSVNDEKGLWYDFGTGQGGNIVDLALLLFNTEDVSDAVGRISSMFNNPGMSLSFRSQFSPMGEQLKKESGHHVVKLKHLGNNRALIDYLSSRGVLRASKALSDLTEVYYDHLKENGSRKRYFGLGLRNLSGGWEVRSKYAKICIHKKDIYYQKGSSDRCLMFEGMFDYLSHLERMPNAKKDQVIVLNSLALIERAKSFISNISIKKIELYLDNGSAARVASQKLLSDFSIARDMASLYKGFDDYNDYLMSRNRNVGR